MRRVSLGALAYAIALSLVVALTPTSAAGAYKTCSQNFPHGVKGTLRTVVIVGYQYRTEGDMEINEQRRTEWLRASLSEQASANPVGLQFVYPERGQAWDVQIIVLISSRGRDSTGHAQAYWATTRVYGMGLKGTDLFNFTTHAYEPDNLSGIFTEASNTIYSYLANGWSCGR